MASTLLTMKNDMTLMSMSGLVQTDITSLLNKCLREEVESYPWSFLYTNIVINAILPYTTGAINVTQGLTSVTSSGATFTPSMVNWYLWVGPTLTTPVIASYATSSTLTLSTGWGGLSLTNSPFTFQPLYYDVAPLTSVERVRQIDFLTETSQEALNRIDPSRSSTGGQPSLRWAPAPFTNAGTFNVSSPDFQIELWPRPTSLLPYLVEGKLGPLYMNADTDVAQIPAQVLEAKAMMYLCRTTFANNGNPKWLQLAEKYENDYKTELDKAIREDMKRVVPRGITSRSGARRFDAAIDYNHDFTGPPYEVE